MRRAALSETVVEEPEILEGETASAAEAFWAQKIWELEAEGPALLTQASQQLMGVTAVLSGIYLAALGLLGIPEVESWSLRALSLTPYLVWLPGFFCAFLAYRPQRIRVAEGDGLECRERVRELARFKRRWSQTSQLLLFAGLTLAVVWVACVVLTGLPGGGS